MSDVGAAILLLQQDATGEDLAQLIRKLMNHTDQLTQMEQKVGVFFRSRAAEDVVRGMINS